MSTSESTSSTSGSTPSAKAEELARQFEQLNDEVIAFVEACDEATWKAICPGEEWSIGAVAAHVAGAHKVGAHWVQSVAMGQPIEVTMDQIHAGNAQSAASNAQRSQADVLERLRRNGEAAATTIRGLSDEDLARSAAFGPAGGSATSCESVIVGVLLSHPRGHLASMRRGTAG